MWVFQAVYSHTPLLAHLSTKIKISVHTFFVLYNWKGLGEPTMCLSPLFFLSCAGYHYCAGDVDSFSTRLPPSCLQSVRNDYECRNDINDHEFKLETTLHRIQEESVLKITARHYVPSGHQILRDK